ncbi:MAG: YjbQ family protein [Zetaproteobacteria bacterium]|nr:MAG: YjbQ family protein [Zetaproteobacteria bacterium]
MRQQHDTLTVATGGRGCHPIGDRVQAAVAASGMRCGVAHLLVQHTSCSLMIQENADPSVLRDMEAFLARIAPDGDPAYRHASEGDDDMAAHIRMALTQAALSIPFVDGRLRLGIWQGIFLYEHRYAPHQRRVALHLIGA